MQWAESRALRSTRAD